MARRDNKMRDRQRTDFGWWLQDTRQRGGYPSQKEFARLLNVTDVQLSRIETGASGIGAETLNIAIDLLKLNPLEAYKKAGLLPKLKINTIEDALDLISYFEQKGIPERDRAALRPLLESADRMIDLLKNARVMTADEFEEEDTGLPHIIEAGNYDSDD